jgi:hypothetical protein
VVSPRGRGASPGVSFEYSRRTFGRRGGRAWGAKAGRRREAEALRQELLTRRSRGYASPVSIALLTVGLGDTTEAFTWLERGVEAHDAVLNYGFVSQPLLEPLRRDPRGAAILRRMGLLQTR